MSQVYIDFRFVEIYYELWAVEQYLEALENSLKYQVKQYPDKAKALLEHKGLSIEDTEVSITFQEIDNVVKDIFPRYFRNPFITILWACLESAVMKISNYAREQQSIRLRLRDLQGDFIKKMDKYYSDVLRSPIQWNNTTREYLINLYKLRNCIAHANGSQEFMSEKGWKDIELLVEKYEGIQSDSGMLFISHSFLHESYIIVSDFINQLIDQVT